MNTPIGRGQTFIIPSSVGGTDLRSSTSYKPRAALKKSATTENVTNCLLNSDSSDPPSTIIRSCQKRFREFGSDERKIISGFLSTPLLVIKTPGTLSKSTRKDLPRSPLQKVTKKSNLGLFFNNSDESSFLVKETSSIESIKSNETILIEESSEIVNSSNSNLIIPNTSISTVSTSQTILNSRKEKEHESFQASIKARAREERERIEAQAALQARRIQKLKAGPTSLPVKSTKPLTVPMEFQLGCDERAQLKKLQSKPPVTKELPKVTKPSVVPKPTLSQKFIPTIPKSPLFASKLRAAAKANKENSIYNNVNKENKENSSYNNVNKENNTANTVVSKNALDIRKKLEYRPSSKMATSVSIPKSPKLLSIHRNRILNNENNNNNKNINNSNVNKN